MKQTNLRILSLRMLDFQPYDIVNDVFSFILLVVPILANARIYQAHLTVILNLLKRGKNKYRTFFKIG